MSQVIVCTGCTSGLGLRTLQLLLASPTPTTLVIGSRTLPPSTPLPPTEPHTIHYLPLDLSSISSTRAFADATRSLLEKRPIDRLFLNAGEWKAEVEAGRGGWVDEAVVNHLGQWPILGGRRRELTMRGKAQLSTCSSCFWRHCSPRKPLEWSSRPRHCTSLCARSVRPFGSPPPTPRADPPAPESVRDTLRLPADGTKPKERYAASKFAQYAAAHAWALTAPVDVAVVAVSPGTPSRLGRAPPLTTDPDENQASSRPQA